LRNLEAFLHDGLQKTANFSSIKTTDITRHASSDAIIVLFELVVAAAVCCDNRAKYVAYIMNMDADRQAEMKHLIQAGMSQMKDYDAAVEEEAGDEDENEFVFGGSDEDEILNQSTDGNVETGLFATNEGNTELLDIKRERDEKVAALEAAQRELAALKNERTFRAEEVTKDSERLREIIVDLQERLEQSQNVLSSAEAETAKTKRQLEEAAASAHEEREKNVQLADELELANDKARQLHKAEATVLAYKKKIESVGGLSQQMQEMENQSEEYLRQILNLEKENKEIPKLSKKIASQEERTNALEMKLSDSSKSVDAKIIESNKLKTDLSAALNAKKMLEEELVELRAHQEGSIDLEDEALSSLSLGTTSATKLRESNVRLEHENEALKKQIKDMDKTQPNSSTALSGDVRAEIEKRDLKIKQLSRDKMKLEQYSKNTLAKFQEKYLVALQECKKQLKEKHEEREQLEMKASVEKTAHKREEQLLSSTIYELGVSILQSKLSSTAQR
jgi:protein HOOK3